ncbi:replicative DNA helicase [Candidatus Neptunochlamydia vexilliferae]|nr:replicative DNA helicase [Candidatus Neptunochlamydia vexilliferae]
MTETMEIASQEAEALILGRMINSIEDRKACCESIQRHHFFYAEHQTLFDALSHLNKEDKPSETQLLIEYLKSHDLIEKAKGADYVFDLAQTAPSPIHLQSYVTILNSNWAKREALSEVKKFSAEIGKTHDVPSFIENFSKRFSAISKNLLKSTSQSFAEISALEGESGYLAELAFRREFFQKHNKPFVDGVSTGYDALDRTIGGFGNSNLIIIASRPGMGKTALALNFAQKVSKNHPVGIVSLEMSSIQLYERMLSMESGVAGDTIREGRTTGQEWKTIERVEPQISRLPIFIQEGSCFLNDITAKIRHLKEEKGIKLLIIDYLQLIRGTGETRLVEISTITRDLKNLAMELHIPIVCLAQLSRKVEERTNHRPLLSDLRESGSIEQDADVVTFLLRPDYYDENDRPGEADLIIAKNRHGKTGEVALHFSKSFAKFDPLITKEDTDNDIF